MAEGEDQGMEGHDDGEESVVREVGKNMEEGWHVLYFSFFTFI